MIRVTAATWLWAHSEIVNPLGIAISPARLPAQLAAILALVGATAVVAQVVLLRELMTAFGGNEMALGVMLSSWLLWTALGSGVLSPLAHRCPPRRLLVLLQLAVALLLPATVFAVRGSRGLFHALPGEALGPVPMLLTSVVALSAFCSVSGWLFAAGARLLAQKVPGAAEHSVAVMYLLEAAGSAAGGILASLVLLAWLDSFQIAALIGLVNVGAAVLLGIPNRRWKVRAVPALALLAPALLLAAQRLDRRTLAAQWPGFRLLAAANSRYNSLGVLENEAGKTLLVNGLPAASVPDPQAAEETVHFALLQHPAPRSLLLIGGGLTGSLLQALRHPTMERVDYVELDPEIIRLAGQYFPGEWMAANDPRVHLHTTDGRLFLNSTAQRFDVIIASLPDPQTAQLNRFYTREFFQAAAARLAPGGLLSFQLRASENYISPELAQLLRCVQATARDVFPDVAVIPGDTAIFLASARAGTLAISSTQMVSRLRSRRLQTAYVREYYLPFRLSPERVADLQQQLAPQPGTRLNHDFAPLAYYFDVTLWSGQFSETYRRWFATLSQATFRRVAEITILLMLPVAALFRWRNGGRRGSAAFCVAATGFTLLGLEVLLLLGFQAIYGYIYHQLAIIIAIFMAGMALGSWRGLRAVSAGGNLIRRLVLTQLLAMLSPLLLYVILAALTSLHSSGALISNAVFPMLALLAGGLGGYQFPLANRIYFDKEENARPGTLYALDLAGACAGALLISAYLVPVFGFLSTAELIATVNLLPGAMAVLSIFKPAAKS